MLQYNCKWNSHAPNMLNSMHSLRDVENFVDVTIVCDGRSLKAHKIVLSTCSALFHQMFLGNPCSHPIIFLADIKFPTLKVIVDFIYSGEINLPEDELEDVLKAAKALDVKGLTDICREKLVAQTEPSENGSKVPDAVVPYRSPRKKRQRTQSGDVSVRFADDPEAAARMDEACGGAESDVPVENGSEGEDEGKNEEHNLKIREERPPREVSPKLKNQKEGPLKRRKKRSPIWNYFHPIDQSVAKCNTCLKTMSYRTSITNLNSHLRSLHLGLYKELEGFPDEESPKLENQKQGPSKREKKRSPVWNYFCPIDQSVARCNTCLKEMSYRTSITNLSSHLRSLHQELYKEFLDISMVKADTEIKLEDNM